MWLANYARDVETGDPFTTGNAILRDANGDQIMTDALDPTTGRWEFKANGQPGIVTMEYDAGGQVKKIAGDAFGQAGVTMEGELEYIFRTFSDGVFSGMALSAPGAMQVQVALGFGMNLGGLHPIYTAENVTIDAAHATLSRIDRIVSRRTLTGTFAGKIELAVVKGTAAASPTAPALTNNSSINEFEIGRVTLTPAASSITTGMLSIASKSVSSPTLTDASVTQAKLAKPSVGTPELFDGSVTLAKMASGIITPSHPGLINTYWYNNRTFVDSSAITALGVDANTLYSVPIYIPRATTLTGVAISCQSIAGTSGAVRVGLYPAGSNGLPGAGGVELGTIASFASTGAKSMTCSQAVAAGWYWLAIGSPGFSYNLLSMTLATDFLGWSAVGNTSGAGMLVSVNNNSIALPSTHPTPAVTVGALLVWFRTSGT